MFIEKKILLIGSGSIAGPCLNYLLRRPENKRVERSLRLRDYAMVAQMQFQLSLMFPMKLS
jgi:hypothetical protein